MKRLLLLLAVCLGAVLILRSNPLIADNTQRFKDNFTRTDNTDLGSVWDAGYTSTASISIVSNHARPSSTALDNYETYNVAGITANQYSMATIVTSANNTLYGVTNRGTAPATQSMYICEARKPSQASITTRLFRRSSGTGTAITSENAITWAVGDRVMIMSVGSRISCWRIPSGSSTPALLLAATDTTHTSGRPGIMVYGFTAVADAEYSAYETGVVNTIAGMMFAFVWPGHLPNEADFLLTPRFRMGQ